MEPFTKAGDKNPKGTKHRDLKTEEKQPVSKSTARNCRQRNLSHVSRTMAAGTGSTALEENLNQPCLVFCSQGKRIIYKTHCSVGPLKWPLTYSKQGDTLVAPERLTLSSYPPRDSSLSDLKKAVRD